MTFFNPRKGEEEVLPLIEQFLEYFQFKNTLEHYRKESQVFRNVHFDEWRPLSYFKKKAYLLSLLTSGNCVSLFNALEKNFPDQTLRTTEYRRLEFDMHLYLVTYDWDRKDSNERQSSMHIFREYLETRGTLLSQSADFLPYYALPYVPDPKAHPVYQKLYTDVWRDSVQNRLASLVDEVLFEHDGTQPRLTNVIMDQQVKTDRTLRQLTSELADAEKRVTQAQRRFSKIQLDYQTLLGVTADLLDALENCLKGIRLEDGVMQNIYSRLIAKQDENRKFPQTIQDGYARNSLKTNYTINLSDVSSSTTREFTAESNEPAEQPLFELDYEKIKTNIWLIDDKQKCYLLQALRWRLTKSTLHQREQCLTSLVRNDLLDLSKTGSVDHVTRGRSPLLACLQSKHHRVREYMTRFVNALSSLCRGRAYLAQNYTVVKLLVTELLKEHDESVTRENLVGALQKMSLRRPMQTVMIDLSVISWVIDLLENTERLSDYTLEYAVALCMNLCLRTAGKRSCLEVTSRVLNVLIGLLGCDNMDITPYVNGALYSILAIPEIRKVAVSMNLKSILENLIKPDQVEMNRQFEFIIRRLLSNEQPITDDSDDDLDDEDDEEDPPTLESDLDRQDMPPPDAAELKALGSSEIALRDPRVWFGEGLLKHRYAAQHVVRGEANGGVDWCKPMLSRDSEARASNSSLIQTSMLRRPSTPGQRSIRSSMSGSRPSTASRFGHNFETCPAVTEESSHPLYLRDSLATLSQDFSEGDTPRASINLDKSISINDVVDRPVTSETRSSVPSATNRKAAFESRPKIARTPESTSPSRDKVDINKCHSPDSTVSSSTIKTGENEEHNRISSRSGTQNRPGWHNSNVVKMMDADEGPDDD